MQLRVTQGIIPGEKFLLDAPSVTIGRPEPGTPPTTGWVFVEDNTVSRMHAHLQWQDEAQEYILTHLSETNQTHLNDVLVQGPVSVKLGDTIRMGLTQLLVEAAEAPKAGPRIKGTPGKPLGSSEGRRRSPVAAPKLPASARSAVGRAGAPRPAPAALEIGTAAPVESSVAPLGAPSFTTPFQLEIKTSLGTAIEPITARRIALGGSLDRPGLNLQFNYDQEIVVADGALPARFFLLVVDEKQGGLELRCPGGDFHPVTLRRSMDGLDWVAMLPAGQSGLVRLGDQFQVSGTTVRLALSLPASY